MQSTPSLTLGKVPGPKTIPTMDFKARGGVGVVVVFAIFALIWVLLDFSFNMYDGQGSLPAPFRPEIHNQQRVTLTFSNITLYYLPLRIRGFPSP